MASEIYPYTSLRSEVEGSLAADPKKISKEGKTSCVVVRVPANYRTSTGEEGAIWMDVKVFGQLADNVYESFSKGDRIIASGPVEGNEYEGKNGTVTTMVMNAQTFGASSRWNSIEMSASAEAEKPSGRKSRDDDDEDDEDEKPRRSSRRSGRDDEDEEDEKPARASRRSSRDDDDEEDEKPRRSSRSSRDDDDDDDEEDEKPRRSSRRSARD